MLLLRALVSVHTVRIDHEIKLLSCLLQGIDKLEGILEMHIVVSGAVGQLQHHRLRLSTFMVFSASCLTFCLTSGAAVVLSTPTAIFSRISADIVYRTRHLVAIRIVLWSVHISLGIM